VRRMDAWWKGRLGKGEARVRRLEHERAGFEEGSVLCIVLHVALAAASQTSRAKRIARR
jgi:hypothetical protein